MNIAIDMIRRSIVFVPALLIVGAIFGGPKGAASTVFAIVVVLANFLLSATMLSWAARISLGALGAAALFGYLLRLGLITLAVLGVRNQPWVSMVIIGVMLIVTHLGLLLWELRYISISLSEPGVRRRTTNASVTTVSPADLAPTKE